MAVLSSSFVVLSELIWWSCASYWRESTKEWIQCTQDEVRNSDEWRYEIGDQCIKELKEDGYSFPNEIFFIAFPIAALFRYCYRIITINYAFLICYIYHY